MIINLSKEFSQETFDEFCEIVNSIPDDTKVSIYMNSEGGIMKYSNMLKDIIESINHVEVIACDRLASSALKLFIDVDVPKRVVDDSYFIYHYMYYPGVEANHEGKVDINPLMKKEIKRNKKEIFKYNNLLKITEKEEKELKKGGNVFISSKRLRKRIKKLQFTN